ncbi:hypothetical protein [Streptomyces sp. NPDC046332]|uniref:hypothetical protein n=1 Tax=unclassified Streptomyces TaxID=2593676 RepID=UPI0033E09CC6
MPISPIPIGSAAWGAPVNDRFTELDQRLAPIQHVPGPGDQTLDGWSFDPATNVTTSVLPTATITWIKLPIRASATSPVTISNIGIGVATGGTTLTVGQNFAGIYSSAGSLLGTTADQAAAWQVVGFKDMALTAPVVLNTSSPIYVALLCRGTTGPTLIRGANYALGADLLNWNTTTATARFASLATAATTLPASVTLSTRTASATAWWAGIR